MAVEDGLTLLRLRGEATFSLITVAAAVSGFQCAFGIGIVRDVAFATGGVTAVPTPIDDQDWDGWIFWDRFNLVSITGTISDGVNSKAATYRMPIDTKAMRKLDLGDVIYGVLQVQELGVSVANWWFDSRVLLALP